MLNQLDDDGQKFMVYYVNQSNEMKVKYNLYEGKCFTIVWAISSLLWSILEPIHFGYTSQASKIFNGIK
jgi:hypothetical protein